MKKRLKGNLGLPTNQLVAVSVYFVSIILFDSLHSIIKFSNSTLVILNLSTFSIILVITYLLINKDLHTTVFYKNKASFRKSIFVILLGFILSNISVIIIFIVNNLFFQSNEEIRGNIVQDFPIILFIFVFIGPILEELIFRRILLVMFFKKLSFFTSTLIVSILFAVWHMSPTDIPLYLMVSIILSYSYYMTNRLSVPIILHIIWNLFVSILQLLVY